MARRKVQLVDKWWRMWSVWAAGAVTVLAGLEAALPELQALMPDAWVPYATAAVIVLRVIKQQTPGDKS